MFSTGFFCIDPKNVEDFPPSVHETNAVFVAQNGINQKM
jgi:hypothetical protein